MTNKIDLAGKRIMSGSCPLYSEVSRITISLLIIIAGLPFMILILLLAFISTGQFPIIFQERKITLEKKAVRIMKIRTIKTADKIDHCASDVFIKEEYEKYVPLFCRWLRKTGIDEIPQLINVIKGEMSIIGPRPLLEDDLQIIKKVDPVSYQRRTKINSKPGISGMWQVYGEREKGASNLVTLDEVYEDKKSFLLDCRIILRSALILFTAAHSDSIVRSKVLPPGFSNPAYS